MTSIKPALSDTDPFWLVLFAVFVYANVGDFVTTKAGLELAGYGAEANPLLRSIMSAFGIHALLLMKAAACAVVWVFRRKINNRTLLKANVVFSALVVNNAVQVSWLSA